MAMKFVKISRWLWQSDAYNISGIGSYTVGQWKVTRRSNAMMVGYARRLNDAMHLAEDDYRTQPDARVLEGDLTGRHGRALMEEEQPEYGRTHQMNTCKCFSNYTEEERQVSHADGTETTETVRIFSSCGSAIAAKRTFKPGHDAKYKAALLWAFRKGVPFFYMEDGAEQSDDPMDLAKERGWGHFMTQPKPKVKKATEATKEQADDAPTDVEGFHPVRVKIGRVIRDAVLVSYDDDQHVTVQYQPKRDKAPTRVQVANEQVVEGLQRDEATS